MMMDAHIVIRGVYADSDTFFLTVSLLRRHLSSTRISIVEAGAFTGLSNLQQL